MLATINHAVRWQGQEGVVLGEPRLELDRPLATGFEGLVALVRGSRRWKPLERIVTNVATVLTNGELEALPDVRPVCARWGCRSRCRRSMQPR